MLDNWKRNLRPTCHDTEKLITNEIIHFILLDGANGILVCLSISNIFVPALSNISSIHIISLKYQILHTQSKH
jgi:hypothetical protein